MAQKRTDDKYIRLIWDMSQSLVASELPQRFGKREASQEPCAVSLAGSRATLAAAGPSLQELEEALSTLSWVRIVRSLSSVATVIDLTCFNIMKLFNDSPEISKPWTSVLDATELVVRLVRSMTESIVMSFTLLYFLQNERSAKGLGEVALAEFSEGALPRPDPAHLLKILFQIGVDADRLCHLNAEISASAVPGPAGDYFKVSVEVPSLEVETIFRSICDLQGGARDLRKMADTLQKLASGMAKGGQL